MATRSRIGMEIKEDGRSRVVAVYCHFDGYPEGVGRTLVEHYRDREKVKKLVELGALSYLEKELEPKGPHSFNQPEDEVTVAYHRDRGERFLQDQYSNLESFFGDDGVDYRYLFTEDGEWLVAGVNGSISVMALGQQAKSV